MIKTYSLGLLLGGKHGVQRKFAHRLGVREATISRYVNDVQIPDHRILFKIARLLKVTPILIGRKMRYMKVRVNEGLRRAKSAG